MVYDLHSLTHKEAEIEVQETLLTATFVGSFDITFITCESWDVAKSKNLSLAYISHNFFL